MNTIADLQENRDVNDPTEMDSKLIITDVMTSTAFSVLGTDFTFYASIYIEHNVGIWNQFYNAEIRTGEPTKSTTFNNSWDATYQTLYNLKVIIDKCSDGGTEAGNYHTLGIAEILSAYNLATLTDMRKARKGHPLHSGGDIQPGVYVSR